MIIAIDFDGTLSYGDYPTCGEPNRRLIDWLNERKSQGDKLILWTCREDKPLIDAVKWCRDQGLTFDAINENLPETIDKWGDSRKIGCDFYIDDAHFTSDFLIKKTEKKLETRKKARII